MDSGIKAPKGPDIHFTNSYVRFVAGNGGISHVLNDKGNGVNSSSQEAYLCQYDGEPEESFTHTNLGALLFLN